MRLDTTELRGLLLRAKDATTCGPCLEYDPEFASLEKAISRTVGQQHGSTVIPPPQPDWTDVYRRALDFFERTLDLRCAVILLRASVRVHGWSELPGALGLIEVLLKHQWDGVHPRADDDDPHHLTVRANVLSSLADVDTVLADLRDSTPWGGSGVTVQDVLLARGVEPVPAEAPAVFTLGELCRALRDSAPSEGAIESLSKVHEAVVQLQQVINALFSPPPDLARLWSITRVLHDLPSLVRLSRLSPQQCGEAVARLRIVAEWLTAEGLTDRVPGLMRRSQRLEMQTFGEFLAEVAPNAPDPLLPARGRTDRS